MVAPSTKVSALTVSQLSHSQKRSDGPAQRAREAGGSKPAAIQLVCGAVTGPSLYSWHTLLHHTKHI